MLGQIKEIIVRSVFFRVFKEPIYTFIALVSFLGIYGAVNLIPNWQTVSALYRSDLGVIGTLKLIRMLQGWLLENSSPFGYVTTIMTIFCFSILIAFVVYAVRRKHFLFRSAGTSTLGMVSSLFGVGCLSCGSVVLSLIFPAAGVAAIRTYLPFHGFEFGPLGLLLVVFSLFLVMKDIDRPPVCSIKQSA